MAVALQFDVELEAYGCLTIDNLAITGLQASGAAPGLPQPPLNQAMLGSPPTSTATPLDGSGQSAVCTSTPWGMWFVQLVNRVNSLGLGTVPILLECPSVDEDDLGWGGGGTIDATTDPVTFDVTIFGTSRYGRKFSVGDYILWDDPTTSGQNFVYEIDQITAISGTKFTLARGSAGGQAAQFGSLKFAHSTKVFFRLIDKFFTLNWNGVQTTFELGWYNKCVCAVVATMPGIKVPTLVNLFPLNSTAPGINLTTTPPCPGLRTLIGNEYAIGMSAPLSVGAIADNWLQITGPESIRSVFVSLATAPTGGPAQIIVIYRSPDKTAAGVIDILNVPPGAYGNYDLTLNRPDQRRQMPYHDGWPPTTGVGEDWPPNVLPGAPGALLASGNIDPSYTGATSGSGILFEEGGWWSYICTLAGTTIPGQVDAVTLQT